MNDTDTAAKLDELATRVEEINVTLLALVERLDPLLTAAEAVTRNPMLARMAGVNGNSV